MENRIKKKVTLYVNSFKDNVMAKINPEIEGNGELINFISAYPRLTFIEDDFSKRKRIKNHVPEYDRCAACRADGAQCTRRKKEGDMYCGTHLKGTPHGEVKQNTENNLTKIELQVKNDIHGIYHYVDNNKKQYPAEKVLNSVTS